jgi:amino acid adenylation domain-containing protein
MTHTEVPLSYGQRALWYLHALAPDSTAFQITRAARIRGGIAVEMMRTAMRNLFARHAALRTTFSERGGLPLQRIHSEMEVPFEAVDARSWGDERLAAALREEACQSLDLERGPVFRSVLYTRDEDQILLLQIHHIVADFASFSILLRDITLLVLAAEAGTSPLAPPPSDYADFAIWQAEMLGGPDGEHLWDYWKHQLAGPLPPLDLPTDRPRPPLQSFRGARHVAVLASELSARLAALAQARGATPYMLLLAAFQVLLHRYTGQDDILVGSPAHGRARRQWREAIGYFSNPLAMRADLSDNPTFDAVLAQVRRTVLGALRRQSYPFPLLVERLHPARDPSRSPIFQVMFTWQQALLRGDREFGPLALGMGETSVHLGGRLVEPFPVEDQGAQFDLTLMMAEGPGEIYGLWQYNPDLFDAATIARMTAHFRVLLEGIVADSTRRISALPLLDPTERRRLLVDWNDTARVYPQDGCIHELIEAQVERTPDLDAVLAPDACLTYRELNQRANALARRLRAFGVGPEGRVGILVERSADMVVALLGVLKAGGAYVPLEATFPRARLRLLQDDAGVAAVVTQKSLRHLLSEPGGPVLCLDDGRAGESVDEPNLTSGARPENLAYVIYTSGSTGTPKGIAIEHRNAANLLHYGREILAPEEYAAVAAVTSICWDVSVFELFFPLAWGGSVVVAGNALALPDSPFAPRVTFLSTVPSALTQLLASHKLPASLRTVIVTGEPYSASLVQAIYQRTSVGRVLNLYAPSETTTYSTFAELGRDLVGAPPLGRPVANTQVHVLDSEGQPVPVGVVGEIHIGGAGVSRGYLGRPELTEERFLPDPLGGPVGNRLYRSGDLGRRRADGTIEYLGRTDDQVKIRGFRIELGEIEATLRRLSGVDDVVVVAREDVPSQKRLVAYLVGRNEGIAGPAELRHLLKELLPDFMLPSAFVLLDALPRTATGKVDRRALPAPGELRPELADTYVGPRTAEEERLAAIWADVLGFERVGVHDDFFELGGDSLGAVRLASEVSVAAGREVPVSFVLRHPTVAGVAAALERAAEDTTHAIAALADTAKQVAEAETTLRTARFPAMASFVTVERRPLLTLFTLGKIAPVDAAAVLYLPRQLLAVTGMGAEEVIRDWAGDTPTFSGVLETALGRIATVLMPRFDADLYRDPADLLHVLGDALAMAGRLGARTVALTGLLPSATDYGRTLALAVQGRALPQITTGHATTTATVVLTIERALCEAGRDLASERCGFLGLGSIGLATLRLLLAGRAHPMEILLRDPYLKQPALDAVQRELLALGYRGPVRVLSAPGPVPAEFYESTLMVAATNVPGLLEVERLLPDTIVVDESAPPSLNADQVMRRLLERRDILVTGGGVLRAPEPIRQLRYLPRMVERLLGEAAAGLFGDRDPHEITGCILSSLLSARFAELAPTLGLVDVPTCQRHYALLRQLGFEAAALHCQRAVVPGDTITSFRLRHGRTAGAGMASAR